MIEYIFKKDDMIFVASRDPWPESPREWESCLGVLYYSLNDYVIGDVFKTNEEINSICEDDKIISFPVYVVIHGQIHLSVNPKYTYLDYFECGMYCIYRNVANNILGKEYDENSPADIKTIEENIQRELDIFSSYLNGNVYIVRAYAILEGEYESDVSDINIHELQDLGYIEEVGVPIGGVITDSIMDTLEKEASLWW